MNIKMIVTALLLSLSLTAAAQFKTIAEAYEVALSDIRLPQNEAGTIAYKTCADCPYETKRVNAATVWEFNGKAMSLKKFRHNVETLDRSSKIAVQVLHHLELNQVTKFWILVP